MRNITFAFAIAILAFLSLGGVRADIMEGLVVYFNFDEEGGVIEDLSGSGNNGTVKGTPKWVDGPQPDFGMAVEFNGAGGHILVADSDSLDAGQDDITIALWVNYVAGDQLTAYPRLISNGMPLFMANGPGFEITVKGTEDDPDHILGLFYGVSGGGRQAVDAKLDEIGDGEWYHLVALKDGEEGRVYVNGELKASGPLTPIDISNDLPLVIGANGAPGNNNWFNGMVDEVAVYMRALTADEISALSKGILAAAGSVKPEGKLPITWGRVKQAY